MRSLKLQVVFAFRLFGLISVRGAWGPDGRARELCLTGELTAHGAVGLAVHVNVTEPAVLSGPLGV